MSAKKTDGTKNRVKEVTEAAGFDNGVAELAAAVIDAAIDEGVVSPEVDREDDGKFDGGVRQVPDASVAASVYTAARIRDIPTKPGEVGRLVDADSDRVARYHRSIVSSIPHTVEPEDPTDWVDRVVDEVVPDDEAFRDRATELCRQAVEAGEHSGKSPSGFAGVVVYAAGLKSDRDIRQSDVADAASVSVPTIRKHYRDVLEYVDDRAVRGNRDDIEAAVNDVCDRVEGLPSRVRADAHELLQKVKDESFVSRVDPVGLAAGVVYTAAAEARFDVSQAEVARTAGVSKATVVNRVTDIREANVEV